MVVVDVTHVFRIFHGPKGLLQVLDKHQHGHGLKYSQVQMWSQRNRIPAKWVGMIIYVVEREGHHCNEFLIDQTELVTR